MSFREKSDHFQHQCIHCDKLKQDSQKVKTISEGLRKLGLLSSRTIYKRDAIVTVHLCVGSGSSRFSLDEPFVLYHKRPLDGRKKLVFANFISSDTQTEYFSDVSEILMGPPTSSVFTKTNITRLAKEKCQGEFLSLLPQAFKTKKPRTGCPPNKCLKVPNSHHVLLHCSEKEKRGSSTTITTHIVAASTEDLALNNTFYMIILYYCIEFNLLAADGFYFEAGSTFQVKGFLEPTVPLYHHLVTTSEAQDILHNVLPQMMERKGVYSLTTLLHRANQIRCYTMITQSMITLE